MTALAAGRSTPRMDSSGQAIPDKFNLPLQAGAVGWQGGIACLDATGNGVDATTGLGLLCVGRWTADFNNTGAAGSIKQDVEQGVFKFASGTGVDLIVQANVGAVAYLIDDQTVGLDNGGGTRSVAGVICQVDSDGGVWVQMGIVFSALAGLMANAGGGASTSGPFKARAVITSLSGTYAGSTTGVLTASSAAAFGTQDGVSTLAVGDVVFLPEGTTNITAASDAGPYVITNIGSGTVKWVLTRPTWYATGAAIGLGTEIQMGGEGTLYTSPWKSFAAKGVVVDTGAPLFYPREVTQSVTLTTGFVTVTNAPIRSLTKTGITFTPTNFNGAGSTVSYRTGAYTSGGAATAAGALGTCSVSITALIAAGTFNTSDVGTGLLTVTNY